MIQRNLSLVILAVVVIAGLGGLARLKFSSFLSDSVSERLEIVATTAARDFETATDLGLSLGEVANGQAILDRARDHDTNIEAIAVFDLDGRIIHSVGDLSGDGAVDGATAEAFRLARLGITATTWGLETDERVSSGVLVEGSFGQPLGGVVVDYPRTELDEQTDEMTGQLARDGVTVVAGMGVLIVATLALMRTRRSTDDGDTAHQRLTSDDR